MRCAIVSLLLILTSCQCASATSLQGAGATFPYPLYSEWATQYQTQTGVQVTYRPIGSGAGIESITSGAVDFAGSDIPLSSAELERRGLLQFPTVVGGIVPIFNIAGIGSGKLHLNTTLLAAIYQGRIRKWNDSEIVALNPKLHLPSSTITVVRRADASGSTFLWTSFLALADTNHSFPVDAKAAWAVGVTAEGNDGVASMVQRTRMAIGYVEYAYARAHRLPVAALQNREGYFVEASIESFRAATEAVWKQETVGDTSLMDAPGASSWPITAASFILLHAADESHCKRAAVLSFFDWGLLYGQATALSLDYLPLPQAVVRQLEKRWADQATSCDVQ